MRLLVQSRRDREADITIPPAVFLLLQSAVHGRAPNVSARAYPPGLLLWPPEKTKQNRSQRLTF